MSSFRAMDVLSSGLAAQRARLETASENLANVQTTRTEKGTPYYRKAPVFQSVAVPGTEVSDGQGGFTAAMQKVAVTDIYEQKDKVIVVQDWTHPDHDANGNVTMPDINVVHEMVDIMTASRSYEANVTAFESLKQMANKAIEIGR